MVHVMTVLNSPAGRRLIRLPVAPKANSRIRFAPLQQPAPQALTPSEALRLVEATAVGADCRIELAGPGDPLVTADHAIATLDALVARHPLARLSLATLGIGGNRLAKVLQKAGLAEIRLQVNAVAPSCLEKIYAWIRPGLKTLALPEATRILVEEQRQTVIAGKEAGLTVTIVTTVFPGYNSDHLEDIARAMAALDADGMVLVPFQAEDHGNDIVLPAVDPAWLADAGRLADCFAILAASAGETPQQQLARVGITVMLGHDNIEGTVDALYGGGKTGKSGRKSG